MTNNWQPFFDQKEVNLKLDTDTIDRLQAQLDKLNKGKRAGKLRMSDMLSHWLLEMGSKAPKIEKSEKVPADLKVTLFGPSSEYLDNASSKNNLSQAEVIEFLLAKYEGNVSASKSRRKRQGAKKSSELNE